jgi:hypothetical protein
MRGFKNHESAERFCREHGELRDLLHPRHRHNQIISATLRRSRFVKAVGIALDTMQAAKGPGAVKQRPRLVAPELTDPLIAVQRRLPAPSALCP